jgi:hypothetical protein
MNRHPVSAEILRYRLSLLLTTAAVVLWAVSMVQAKFIIGFYGLIHSYPVIYFASLGLLTVGALMLWTAEESHPRILCLQLCLFILMVFLPPILIGANPVSTWWTYGILFPNSDYIAQTGHFNTNLTFDVYSLWTMQNWPGAFFFEAIAMKITGASTADFVALYSPVLMQFLILPPLYIFFKNTIPKPNHCWGACWLFFLVNWTAQLYLCPQAIGMLLLITLLALLSRTASWQNETASAGQQFSIILILTGISITHMLTSIVAFLSVIALGFTKLIKGFNLTILAGVLVAFWTIYGAASQLELSLPGYIGRAFRLDLIFHFSALNASATSSPSLLGVAYIRYIFTALVAVIGVTGFLFSRKYRDNADRTVLSLLGPAFLVLFSMLYGAEFWARVFLFSLIPVAYFGIKMLRSKAGIALLSLLILAALPTSIISHYGFAAIDYEPSAERGYWHFMTQNSIVGGVFGGTRIYYPDYTYAKYYLDEADWENEMLVFPTPSGNEVQYVHTGTTDRNAYEFTLNDSAAVPEMRDRLEDSPNYSLIYANPGAQLYFHQYQP